MVRRRNQGEGNDEAKVCGLVYRLGFESIAQENFQYNKNHDTNGNEI